MQWALLCSMCAAAGFESSQLHVIVERYSRLYNVSLSASFTLASGETVTAAAGMEGSTQHAQITPASIFPSGSATKTFTAVATMRLVDAGKLELDRPFHEVVDPWLKVQGKPSLRELWGGNTTVSAVSHTWTHIVLPQSH